MKKIALFWLVGGLAGLALVLSGCVSLQQQYANSAEEIVELINDGEAKELYQMSRTPFLLDGEIIILDNDVRDLWKTITAHGARVKNLVLVEAYPVEDKTYRRFADTFEVESYFKNYVSDEGHVVIVETEEFRLFLLMDKNKKGDKKLIGMKGPVAL